LIVDLFKACEVRLPLGGDLLLDFRDRLASVGSIVEFSVEEWMVKGYVFFSTIGWIDPPFE